MTYYLAGPLFTLAERNFNVQLAAEIRRRSPEVRLIVPQEAADALPKDKDFFRNAFRACIEGIDESDCVIGILDGADADSGTCFELGYAYARKIPVIGVRTDFRALEEHGLNLMLSQGATALVLRSDVSIEELAERIIGAFRTRGIIASTQEA